MLRLNHVRTDICRRFVKFLRLNELNMKRAVSISLRFVALVALYMLIGWAFGMYETFSIWRMLLIGCIFSGIMLGFSEWQSRKRQR